MNAKFLNPFVEAAHEVIEAETGLNMGRGVLSFRNETYITEDVTVIINLIGQIEGTVFYSMSNQTAMVLASSMLSEQLEEFDNLAQSGVAELGNVITGQASIKLSQKGYLSNISTPTMVIGKDATISTLGLPRLVVPLERDSARVIIHLALRESNNTVRNAAKIPQAPQVLSIL